MLIRKCMFCGNYKLGHSQKAFHYQAFQASNSRNVGQILFIPVGKFRPQQSISSGNGLKITISPTYHSLREQVGDTIIF